MMDTMGWELVNDSMLIRRHIIGMALRPLRIHYFRLLFASYGIKVRTVGRGEGSFFHGGMK